MREGIVVLLICHPSSLSSSTLFNHMQRKDKEKRAKLTEKLEKAKKKQAEVRSPYSLLPSHIIVP